LVCQVVRRRALPAPQQVRSDESELPQGQSLLAQQALPRVALLQVHEVGPCVPLEQPQRVPLVQLALPVVQP
jgi:hypothetical protein